VNQRRSAASFLVNLSVFTVLVCSIVAMLCAGVLVTAGTVGFIASGGLQRLSPTKPAPPREANATADDVEAAVTWTPPITDGGARILSYTVTSSPDSVTVTVDGKLTTALVTSLTNGTAYTFTVTAANSVGTSRSSNQSNQVTPLATIEATQSVTIPGATVTYFNVTGSDMDEVFASIKASNIPFSCPPGDQYCSQPGGFPIANTHASLIWPNTGVARPAQSYCYRTADLPVSWQVTVLFPRWSPPPTARNIDVAQWNWLVQIVAIHEGRHAQIDTQAFEEFMPNVLAATNCRTGIAILDQMWTTMDERNVAYHNSLVTNCEPDAGCVPSNWESLVPNA
jgi:hypothetical protein